MPLGTVLICLPLIKNWIFGNPLKASALYLNLKAALVTPLPKCEDVQPKLLNSEKILL